MPRKNNKSASLGTNCETVAANTGRTSLGRTGRISNTWDTDGSVRENPLGSPGVPSTGVGPVNENPPGSPDVPEHYAHGSGR